MTEFQENFGPMTIILQENFRMVESLSNFTQRIYSKKLKSQVSRKERKQKLDKIKDEKIKNLLKNILEQKYELVSIILKISPEINENISKEKYLECEANIVSRIVEGFR